MEQTREVCFEVRRLSNLIRREADKSHFKSDIDKLTGTNGWIIGFLADHANEDIYQRDLEEKFSVRRSTASKTIQLMEQKGFIRRESVAGDARLKKLILTDKSWEIHNRMHQEMLKLESKLIRDISREDLDCFFKVICKIKENINNIEGNDCEND